MKIKLFIILLILSCSFACKKNQDENTKDTPIEQLLQENTPESTVKSWQYFMDNNDFDQAKEIANEEAKEFLNEKKISFSIEVDELIQLMKSLRLNQLNSEEIEKDMSKLLDQ